MLYETPANKNGRFYKLEKSDYTEVRDTPAWWLGNFHMPKIAGFIFSLHIIR